jgi:hypothetical protein
MSNIFPRLHLPLWATNDGGGGGGVGTWMSIQRDIEGLHKNRYMKANVLTKITKEAFWHCNSYNHIIHIDKRWKLNMQLILLGKGGNDLVECKRGKKSSFDDLPTEPSFQWLQQL